MKKLIFLLLTAITFASGNFEIVDGRVSVLSPDTSTVLQLYRTNTQTFMNWTIPSGDNTLFLIGGPVDLNLKGMVNVGNLTQVGNITGADIDISAGTGDYTSSGTITAGSLTVSGLTETRVIFAGVGGLLSDDAGMTYNAATDSLTLLGTVSATTLTDTVATLTSGVFTGLSKITMPDDTASAFSITEASTNYLLFDTSNGLELLTAGVDFLAEGNLDVGVNLTVVGVLKVDAIGPAPGTDDDLIELATGNLIVNAITLNQNQTTNGIVSNVIFNDDTGTAVQTRVTVRTNDNAISLIAFPANYAAVTAFQDGGGLLTTNAHLNLMDVSGSHNINFFAGGNTTSDIRLQISGAGVTQIGLPGTNHLTVEADADTFWVGDGTGLPYGHMYVDGTQSIVVALTLNTPAEVEDDGTTSAEDGWLEGDQNLITFPTGGTQHYITITKAGVYHITWNLSFKMVTGAANTQIHAGLTVDSTTFRRDRCEAHRTISNNTDTGNMAGTCTIDLPNGNEELSLWMENTTNNNDAEVFHGSLTAVMVGGT